MVGGGREAEVEERSSEKTNRGPFFLVSSRPLFLTLFLFSLQDR